MSAVANVKVKKGKYLKWAFFKGTVAVGVAISGTSFIAKPITTKAATTPVSEPTVNIINKTSKTYTTRNSNKRLYEISVVSKGAKFEMPSNIEDHNISSTISSLPIKFVGKLPVGPENDYSINNDREFVDVSHKIEKIKIPVVYGGRLPVGRER